MNIAAGDNCVLIAVISQKFALLAHFCIADVVFLLTRYNYHRANGDEQFTGRANVIGRREASETKHREPGNVEKNKIKCTSNEKKRVGGEGGGGKRRKKKIECCTENVSRTYVYIYIY